MLEKRKIFTKILQSAAFMGIIILLGIFVKEYSTTIGLFNNIEVQIKGNQFVKDAQIQDQLYPHLTQSLLSLRLNEIQEDVINIDFIETVQVSRVLPHTLLIQVVERNPMLLLNINDVTFFMDVKGVILPANRSSISFFPVPIITISKGSEQDDGKTHEIAEFFQFILNDYPLFYNNLSEVIISADKWIFFNDSKTRIFATPENLFTQFKILKNFEKTVYPNRRLDDYSYIDLRVDEQVVVKEKYRKG